MEKHKHDTPEQRKKFEAYMVACGRSAVITWENDRPVWSSDRCDWHTWLHCCEANETTVAELVALLRMGRELSRSSRDIEAFFAAVNRDRATADVNRILGQYDEAIATHGGA